MFIESYHMHFIGLWHSSFIWGRLSQIALVCLKTQLCRCYKSVHTKSQKKEKPSMQKNGQKMTR